MRHYSFNPGSEMNWKKQLFKPKWLHKDSEVRRQAVNSSTEADLLAELPRIVREDEHPDVRAAAARRISSPLVLADALTSETDAGTAQVLRERLRQLLINSAQDDAPQHERLQTVEQTSERELLESVAEHAQEPELRRAALARVTRQGFLGDRAIADPDPENRRLAAAAVTQQSTLKRVIAATRTSDKALHQELTERLHHEMLAKGDKSAIQQEALTVCQSLEHYLQAGGTPSGPELGEIKHRWSKVAQQAPEALQRRFQNDLDRLQAPVATQQAAAPAPAKTTAESPPEPKAERKPEAAETEQVDTAEAPVAAPPDQQALAAERESRRVEQERREALLAQSRHHLEQLALALENGELHKALEIRAELQHAGKGFGKDRGWAAIQRDLNATLGRLRELRDWQHWANDKIRKRLIDDMEALPAAGLHPDAVLERLKSLQGEWKALEASEQIPGDRHYAAAPSMWRRFNAAGRQAFQMTKPFLDKRSEVQSKHLDETRQIAQALIGLIKGEDTDWKALGPAMAKARKALRSLSSVPAKSRQKMAAQLKAALEAGNNAMQARYGEIEKIKLKLIREAAQLQHAPERAEAIQRAKALQAEWQSAGSLWRSRDNELWGEFRASIDPLFKQLDAERETVREEQAESKAAQTALCQQMDELASLDDELLIEQQGRVQGLSDEWQEFPQVDRRLRERFDKHLAAFRARVAAQERTQAKARRLLWWDKAELLHQAEHALVEGKIDAPLRKRLEKTWPAPASHDTALDQALDERFRSTLQETADAPGAGTDYDSATEAARKICICLEFLAGIPTPDEEKALRMQYQVERLSASMSGDRERLSAREEASQLESEWLKHAYLPDPAYSEFAQRARVAIDKILEE